MTLVRHFALKETAVCPCTDDKCPREGTWSTAKLPDGARHIKKCKCIRCKNGMNRKSGTKSQAKIPKFFGFANVNSLNPGNEETIRTVVRFEAKSGAQCKSVHTFHRKCREQSDAAKSFGDDRPVIITTDYDDDELGILYLRDLPELVARLGSAYGYWSA